jgi:hypothetical protein
MKFMKLEEIDAALRGLGAVYVHLKGYVETHGQLHVRFTEEGVKNLADLYLADCYWISGLTFGGPWTLEMTGSIEDRQPILRFAAGGEKLVIKSLRAQLSVIEQRGETPEAVQPATDNSGSGGTAG